MYPYQIKSLAQYHQVYQKSIEAPETFWAEIAEHFIWKKKWDKVLTWNFEEPNIKWFEGATLNITENCLDRWAKTQPNSKAIIWEPNNPEEDTVTLIYRQLLEKVNQVCYVLKNNGAKKGDRICIYMPMVPELMIAMLACARIGAIHNVIFGGFSAKSITDRINDASCNIVITADGAYRGNKIIHLKKIMDDALQNCNSVKRVIVLQRIGNMEACEMISNRDVWFHDEIAKVEAKGNLFFEAVEMNAEDVLFILYTSGSTGKPKGVVHTCGGYMVYTNYTFVNVFQYQIGDIYFCTADIGWITGHSYMVYGPLSAGATVLMFEGIPTYPNAGRFWEIVQKHQVNILYTAPTAIRSLMAYGIEVPEKYDLRSVKVLGSVGEPINEEAWHWFDEHIGKGKCPIVDTWWQTETAGIMISNLAGVTPHKPTYATLPMPGIRPVLMDENGHILTEKIAKGNLCISFPWPGIIRTTYGNHLLCKQTYFTAYKNMYFTGDGCLRNAEGQYRITGRVDDVLNVSGHRIGTAEVENAINMHPLVIESAIVAYPHSLKGHGIYGFVILNTDKYDEATVLNEINEMVSNTISAIAKPDKIQIVSGLPKTRSGKIMRRILRKIAEGEIENLGDISTLLDPNIVEQIVANKL